MKNRKILATAAALTVIGAMATGCLKDTPMIAETQTENGTAAEKNLRAEISAVPDAAGEADDKKPDAEETTIIDGVEIVNSYDNTEKLMDKFPVVNKTELRTDLEKGIANRLLTGFENWNRGFDAWKAWGSILYTEDSIYNVHGARLTLPEYQASMDMILKQMDLTMGNFNNMLIVDDWAAIYYDINTNGKPGTTMEFVKFKDYGDELGVRVVEGWGGPKDKSYDSMCHFQTEEENASEKAAWMKVMEYRIPDTDVLEDKYIVKNPTTVDESGLEIKEKLLQDFEYWNKGSEDWSVFADQLYSKDAVYHRNGNDLSLKEMKEKALEEEKTAEVTKLYFDNMLIRDNWAAIHYRELIEDKSSGEKEACDRMEFLHFDDADGELKVIEHWVK